MLICMWLYTFSLYIFTHHWPLWTLHRDGILVWHSSSLFLSCTLGLRVKANSYPDLRTSSQSWISSCALKATCEWLLQLCLACQILVEVLELMYRSLSLSFLVWYVNPESIQREVHDIMWSGIQVGVAGTGSDWSRHVPTEAALRWSIFCMGGTGGGASSRGQSSAPL